MSKPDTLKQLRKDFEQHVCDHPNENIEFTKDNYVQYSGWCLQKICRKCGLSLWSGRSEYNWDEWDAMRIEWHKCRIESIEAAVTKRVAARNYNILPKKRPFWRRFFTEI